MKNEIDKNITGTRYTDEQIEALIDEKLSTQYQKLRSETSVDVAFTSGSSYIAPCDGYYLAAWETSSTVGNTMCWIDHYLADNTLISRTCGTCKDYDRGGCEIYLKKGEYIKFNKQQYATVVTSKFFYAVGCQPDPT